MVATEKKGFVTCRGVVSEFETVGGETDLCWTIR